MSLRSFIGTMAPDPLVARTKLEAALRALIMRHAGERVAREAPVELALERLVEALKENADDGFGLSALTVTRIRLGKFVASQVPAKVFRDARELSAIRAEIALLAEQWLREHGQET